MRNRPASACARRPVGQPVPLHRLPPHHRCSHAHGLPIRARPTGAARSAHASRAWPTLCERSAGMASLRLPGSVRPRTVDELAARCWRAAAAVLLAGGTDVGLWVTKQLRDLPHDRLHRRGRRACSKSTPPRSEHRASGRRSALTDAWARHRRRLPAAGRTGAALWLSAGSQFRHAVRQSRQWLADRRCHAGADRAGRRDRTAPRRRHAPTAARPSSISATSARILRAR